MNRVGWIYDDLKDEAEQEMYQRLLKARTKDGNHGDLLKLLKKRYHNHMKRYSSISDAFNGELSDDDLEVYNGRNGEVTGVDLK